MQNTSLFAATAALILSTSTLAVGAEAKKFNGLVDLGYNYTSIDPNNSPNNINVNQLHFGGSGLWTWPGNWNAQANLNFTTDRASQGSSDAALDTWKLGGGVFYRDKAEGLLGGEIHYQSLDALGYADGISITGRGEAFLSDANVGGYLGYSNFSANSVNLDTHGWSMGAYGKYFTDPHLGFKVGLDYATYKVSNADLNDVSLNGEAEYLLPDCNTSVYAGLGFGSMDLGTPEADYWRLGLGLRVHLGTGGSLLERNRNEPLANVPNLRVVD